MPARIDLDERPIITSFTILPSHKELLDNRARELSYRHGKHISASTILRELIDGYRQRLERTEDKNVHTSS